MAPIGERGGDRMDKKITYWQTVCFLFLSVVGTLLHFLFDWSGGSWAAALIAPVNESIWEHLKLLVFPMVAFALAQSRWSGIDPRKVLAAKGKGLVVGMILIPVLYYLVSGSLGSSPEWFNIALFASLLTVILFVEYGNHKRRPMIPLPFFFCQRLETSNKMKDFDIENAIGEDGKWETVSSEYLFRRPWLTVRHDKVRLPDGRINPEFYVLEYPDWVNVSHHGIRGIRDGTAVQARSRQDML